MNIPVSLNNVIISPHFNLSEFQCHCCGRVMIYVPLVLKLEAMRLHLNKALHLDCVYRCSQHNKEVGGVVNSLHLIGCAADVNAIGIGVTVLEKTARQAGFNEVIPYPEKNFVHCGIEDLTMKDLLIKVK